MNETGERYFDWVYERRIPRHLTKKSETENIRYYDGNQIAKLAVNIGRDFHKFINHSHDIDCHPRIYGLKQKVETGKLSFELSNRASRFIMNYHGGCTCFPSEVVDELANKSEEILSAFLGYVGIENPSEEKVHEYWGKSQR